MKSKVIDRIIAGSSVIRIIKNMEENSIAGIIKRLKTNYTSEVMEQMQKGLKYGITTDTIFNKSLVSSINDRQIIKPTYPNLEKIEYSLKASYKALEQEVDYWKQKYYDNDLGWETFVEKECILKKTDREDN